MKKTVLLILVVLLAVLIGYFWPASSSEKIAKIANPSAERDTRSAARRARRPRGELDAGEVTFFSTE